MKQAVCGILIFLFIFSTNAKTGEPRNLDKAKQTQTVIYALYADKNTKLLRENYPFDAHYSASYLATTDTGSVKRFAYLWPFSGTFSGSNALLRISGNKEYLQTIKEWVLPALEAYYDDTRQPSCYQSYLAKAGHSDRFYDDNVWVAIDFVDLYVKTKDKQYLEKSKMVWKFIASGTDEKLGGGIYWCEQKKHSKNTCSNAPGAVLALKLFEATHDSLYFREGLNLYNWTKKNLQDPTDKLYYDNISLRGKVDKAKYAYNSGQMLQAASLLYKLTKNKEYLFEAQGIAQSCIQYFTSNFTPPNGKNFRLIKKGNVWFTAVMMRGFVELYSIDKNKKHLEVFNQSLQYAWEHNRNVEGLFSEDWSGNSSKKTCWLLDQAAMVEMYACIATIIK